MRVGGGRPTRPPIRFDPSWAIAGVLLCVAVCVLIAYATTGGVQS